MAGTVNKVILIGNVGKDPEIRSTQGGDQIANFTLATSESWTDKHSGERKERTEWHKVVCFNTHLIGAIEKYLRKGTKVYVEGVLRTRKWTDQAGVERYSTEVCIERFNGTMTMLSGYGDQAGGGAGASGGADRSMGPQAKRPGDELDDEIPF